MREIFGKSNKQPLNERSLSQGSFTTNVGNLKNCKSDLSL